MIGVLIALGLGWFMRAVYGPETGNDFWMVGLIVCAVPIVWRTLRDCLRGRFATDIVATLAIVGAIAIQIPMAGLIVVLMLRGGERLEEFARGRASRAVHALELAAPRIAHRIAASEVIDVDVADVV